VQVERGNTSVTFGDLRHHGGTTWDLNWAFLAVSGSTRRSFTRTVQPHRAVPETGALQCEVDRKR
jgi:hypothetical protein